MIEAGQLSQSSHFALQLPYVIFGLGQTPNFVDEVGVGIPNVLDGAKVLSQFLPHNAMLTRYILSSCVYLSACHKLVL